VLVVSNDAVPQPGRSGAVALEVLRGHIHGCREALDGGGLCWKPADYVLWGKLIPPEGLGPRCYECALRHVSHSALGSRSGYALINLRDLANDLANQKG